MDKLQYKSIFWDSNGGLAPYLGWDRVPGIRGFPAYEKQSGPVLKRLYLIESWEDLIAGIPAAPSRLLTPVTIIHDFSAPANSATRTIEGRQFRPASRDERVLNIDTFVIDLTLPQEALLANIRKSARSMLRKAESLGATAVASKATSETLSRFIGLYTPFARERRLSAPNIKSLRHMMRDGHLVCAHAQLGNAEAFNLIFTTAQKAYYLHGVVSDKGNLGLGNLVQWATIRYLKDSGFSWYDLGGIPSRSEADGIYKFKKSFGGSLVPLGQEFIWTSAGTGLALRIGRRIRKTLT